MSLDYEQSKEIEALIERRMDLFARVSKMESRLSVIESLDAMTKAHEKDIRRLWIGLMLSVFTALAALVAAILVRI